MNLNWSDEQQTMRQMVHKFAVEKVAKAVEHMEKTDEFPAKLVKEMGELGLMGIPIPQKYGGLGMDYTSYILAIQEISRVSAAVGVILSVHTSVGTNPILYFGTEEQKQRYIPKLASGKYVGAFALSEPSAGSDSASIRTTAKHDGNDYILNGSKAWITSGGEADTYIVFAKTNPTAGKKGISAFIVEKGTPGFTVLSKERKMGLHGSNTTALSFEDCRIAKQNLLGKEGEGFKIAMSNLNTGRIGIAAQSLGVCQGALEAAIAYAKKKKQFGTPIDEMQGVASKLADMVTKYEAAKLLTYQAADFVSRNLPVGNQAAMAKMFASDSAMNITTEAIQVFGEHGYTKDYPVERFFRDAKVTQIYEGTNEIQRLVISNKLLRD
ncbi:acyl-CoA dehydrogenase [Aquibacillus saliphilus]|uniref:acyl-CoA dehydrogenase n=1 Tax=Aquibacillus saliphilus TaxID=1909422 RepID=UPI001CEFFF02|nr:acyl-CoA dehydrogenase [Aquibacillus saliphilus]